MGDKEAHSASEWRVRDDLAKAIFERHWGGERQWSGRNTNRAYYRRLAFNELKLAPTPPQSNGE